jgi:hypothetical protein
MVNEYSQTGKRQTDSVTVTIHTGDQKVTPEGYMSCLGALQPSAFVTLPDELPRAVNKARARTSVERTAKVKHCLRDWQFYDTKRRYSLFLLYIFFLVNAESCLNF